MLNDPAVQAKAYGVPVMVANHIFGKNSFFLGESMIVDRDGTIVAEAPQQADVVVLGEVRLKECPSP